MYIVMEFFLRLVADPRMHAQRGIIGGVDEWVHKMSPSGDQNDR